MSSSKISTISTASILNMSWFFQTISTRWTMMICFKRTRIIMRVDCCRPRCTKEANVLNHEYRCKSITRLLNLKKTSWEPKIYQGFHGDLHLWSPVCAICWLSWKSDICQTSVKMSFNYLESGESVYAYEFNGYWKDVSTIETLGSQYEVYRSK